MKQILCSLITLSLVGCSSVGVTRLKGGDTYSERCDLEVFTEPSLVKRPYEEVCLIDSRTGSTAFHDKSIAGAIKNARGPACKCGADAIIISGANTEGAGFNSWGHGAAIIKAVRFTDSK